MDLIIENKNVKLGKNHIFLEGTFGILKKKPSMLRSQSDSVRLHTIGKKA